MLHQNPTPPPIPSLAFSEEEQDGAHVFNGEVLEGIVTPKKEKEAHLFRRRSESAIGEKSKFPPSSSPPPTVKILVAPRERIEKWLRECGPGSSCLWAQAEDFSQCARGKVLSTQLKLTCRLHSEQSLLFLPVLSGTILELSPSGGALRINSAFKKSAVGEMKRSSFVMEPQCSTMQSPSNASSTSAVGGDMSPILDRSAGIVEVGKSEKSVVLVIPEKAYRQLVAMVSPGGIIREYQEFLRRSVASSNFLDVDFRLLDLPKWLKYHPFAAFLEGSDVMVVRRGDGPSGLRWALLRFDFGEGLVRSIKGEVLTDLELIFGNKGSNLVGTRAGWWGSKVTLSGERRQEKHLERNSHKLDWTIRTFPVTNGVSGAGPLSRLLFDVLESDGALSVAEIKSLKLLFGTEEAGDSTQVPCHSAAGIKDIQTVLASRRSRGMSSMEICALSHMKGDSEELKGRGLRVLLNLLLGVGSNTAQATDRMVHKTPKCACLVSSHSNFHTKPSVAVEEGGDAGLETERGVKLLESTSGTGQARRLSLRQPRSAETAGRLRKVAAPELRMGMVGSQSERALKAGDSRNLCKFVESEYESGVFVPQDHDCKVEREIELLYIVNWLESGFLETLLERLMVGSEGGQRIDEDLERGGFLNLEVALEVCLRVLQMVPKEGSLKLAKLLVLYLKETYEDVMKLNLNHNQHWNRELDEQIRVHIERKDGSSLTGGIIFESKRRPPSTTLQKLIEKLLRFCKLLSLLTSRSPLVGGPFAELGGLDLVMDLYLCLGKRFPFNLRLGALSSAVGSSKSLEQILPGEVIKSQDTPLKVLPCILPSACICRVAQACLMDHCMTPKKEKVEFAWPHTSEWKALYPFKHRLVDCQFNLSERSHYDGARDNPLVGPDFHPWPEAPEVIELNKSCKSTPAICASELNCVSSHSSNVTSCSSGSGCSPHANNSTTMGAFQVERTAHSHLLKQTRPFVPRLSLNTLRSSTSRFGPSVAASREAELLQDPDPSQVPSIPGESTLKFEIFTTVCNVKLELLQTMCSLFSNCSHSLSISRCKLLQKFQKEEEDQLVLQFLPDIIGGFLNIVPENTSRRAKRMLFEVISLLDKCKTSDDMTTILSSCDCRVDDPFELACKIDPSPSFPMPKRFVDSLILEIGERLRILVCHLAQMLATSKDEASCNTKRTCEYCSPHLEDRTISSGHLLSLWVDVGLLLRVLGDFILLWPGGGSVQCLLNSCGRQLESVLSLLANYSSTSNWSLAQILTMEHLLKLLTVCIKNSVLERRPESHKWCEIDTFFWQLLLTNDTHWNCVKSFTTWVVMKSCQGCLRGLFEGYQKVLWEPLEIYYNMLGEQINRKSAEENLACTLHEVDMSRRSIFPFLRVSILMISKKLKCQGQSSQACPILYMGRLLFLLDFLMNPVEGLLMNVIRRPVPCIKLNKILRESEALNLLNFTSSPNSMSEMFVLNSPGPTSPANADTLYWNHMQEHCRKCASTPCAANCDEKFTSCMKQESLRILADIFALKSFDHHDEQANLCANPRAQNPFLFRKYVDPFLETVLFYFLKVYNKKVEDVESWLTSPLSQCASGHSKMSVNSRGQQLSEPMIPDDRSTGDETGLPRNDQDHAFCSVCSQNDEASSVVCVTYGQLLRALAQNQTDDVSQSFQHMGVMKFLVQQIGLEYEVSQVATPRDIQLPLKVTTPLSLQELQRFDCRDFEARITKGLCWHGERSTAPVIQDKVEDVHHQTAGKEDNMRSGYFMRATNFGGVRNSLYNTATTSSALLARTRCPSSARNVDVSSTSFDKMKLCTHECILGSSLQNSHHHHHHHLGFRSARDVRSAVHRRFQLEDYLPKSDFPNFQGFIQNDQKKLILSTAMPSGQQDGNSLLKKCNVDEHGTLSTQASSQTKGGSLNMSNTSSEECSQTELRPATKQVNYGFVQRGTQGSNHLRQFSNPSAISSSGDAEGQQALHDAGGANMGTSLTEVRYTGRFFDLNEEVDRALAQEGFPDAQRFSQMTQHSAQNMHFDMMDNLQEEKDLQTYDSKLVTFDIHNTRPNTANQSSDSELSSESGPGILPKNKINRPSIPRLNLSKSVRKGGPAVNSDAFMEFEHFPSTAITRESKYRLNAMFEVQRGQQKEVVSSDRNSPSVGIGVSYETERLQRRLYRHAGLHVVILELFVSLMLTPQGKLEACYSDRYPMENRKLNAPFFLSYHLNHAANLYLLPCLSKKMKDFKPAAFRILKLTWRALFNPRIYTSRVRIARGAASQVYTAKVKKICSESKSVSEGLVVLKIVDVPKGPYDPCKFFDVYSEVEILEKFLGEPAVCQILDYGVDTESFILVLKHYKCSLHIWRQGHNGNSDGKTFSPREAHRVGVVAKFVLERLPLYLEVYSAVLQAVKVLETENVVHYDLKCDNILLEPVDPFCSESEFWTPTWPPEDSSKPLPFRICIADFGQSKASAYLGGECTVRNRGTEYVKSPEMLKLLSSQSQRDSDFNLRNTDEGVGKAVDVWSLGCLLYELLTGEYLFYDDDWLQFFMRVTLPSEELIAKEKATQLENYGPVLDLLKFILVRDPLQRPSLDDVAICVEQLQLKLEAQAVAKTRPADEIPTKIQMLSEEDSETDGYNSDEQIISSDIEIVSRTVETKRPVVKSLECLRRLICHCQCGEGE